MFLGPYEHHSNELPWRESIAEVVPIRERPRGSRRRRPPGVRAPTPRRPAGEDRQLLGRVERDRDHHRRRPGRHHAPSPRRALVLGLRRRRAVSPDRHERRAGHPDGQLAYKDAVFISPHKFVGGPGTPGLLVVKRSLLRNRVPSVPGGGTVLFVSPSRARVPSRAGDPGGGRYPGDRRSRFGPGLRSRSRTRSAARRSSAASTTSRDAHLHRGAGTRRSRSSATPRSSASRSSRSACATRAGCSTRTSSWPCSATSSASRRAAAASAPGRTSTGSTRSTTTGLRA